MMNISIRDIDQQSWKELRIVAIQDGLTVGQALNRAIERWLFEKKEAKHQKKAKSFWDLPPLHYEGKDATQLSTQVDEVLYR